MRTKDFTRLLILSTLCGGLAHAGPAVLDWTTGLAPEPGQELSLSSGLAFLQTESLALGGSASLAWTKGFTADSSDLLTAAIGGTGYWRPDPEKPWLLSAEPFVLYRMVDFSSALVVPGIRLSAEFLRESDSFAMEFAHEGVVPTMEWLEPLRGTRQTLRLSWRSGDVSSNEGDSLQLGIYGMHDPIMDYSAAGPEVSGAHQFSRAWRGEIAARFGFTSESLASLRVSWQAKPTLTPHLEFSHTRNPEAEGWSSLAGISFTVL